jgi:hypothetical protein
LVSPQFFRKFSADLSFKWFIIISLFVCSHYLQDLFRRLSWKVWVASGLTVMISGIVKLRHGSKFCLWNDNPLDYVVYFAQRIALSGCVTMFNNQTTTLSWFSQKELVLTTSTRSCSRRWTLSSFTLWWWLVCCVCGGGCCCSTQCIEEKNTSNYRTFF